MKNFKQFIEEAKEKLEILPLDHPDRKKNFDNWFGNSVTHENGVPKVYYTGTSKDKDFKSFNIGRHGAWFTTDQKEASMYAHENDSQGFDWHKMEKTNTAARVIPAHIKAENPHTEDMPQELKYASNYKKAQSDWFDSLRAKGHDSWIPSSAGGKLVVVLKSPNQIKSAIGNSGQIQSNKNNIHETKNL